VNHPELAADPTIAADIAVVGMRDGTFTHHKLGDYVNDNNMAHPDYVGARRVINGTNEAQEIATQATGFQHVLEQHRGDYASEMLKAQMDGLPSAAAAPLSGNPGAATADMFAAQPMTTGAEKFVPADQMLRTPVGKFSGSNPTANITTLKTHTVDSSAAAAPAAAPTTDPATNAAKP
jgi:hypothetical protein